MSKLTNQELEEKINSLSDRELMEKNVKYSYLMERHLQNISFVHSFFFWTFAVISGIGVIFLIMESN